MPPSMCTRTSRSSTIRSCRCRTFSARPHLGWAEWENFELYFREAFEQIVAYERGFPLRLANPQVRVRPA